MTNQSFKSSSLFNSFSKISLFFSIFVFLIVQELVSIFVIFVFLIVQELIFILVIFCSLIFNFTRMGDIIFSLKKVGFNEYKIPTHTVKIKNIASEKLNLFLCSSVLVSIFFFNLVSSYLKSEL
jgi:hypothetical protein